MNLQHIFILLVYQIILNLLLLFFIKPISNFFKIFDYPDKNLKKHKNATPLIGGIFIFLNFFFCIAILSILNIGFFPLDLDLKQKFSFYSFSVTFYFESMTIKKIYFH